MKQAILKVRLKRTSELLVEARKLRGMAAGGFVDCEVSYPGRPNKTRRRISQY